ncbi:MAG: TrkH family potassium uptake protein, partial [Bacteroidales bacterium]|nr:TrkH family potassium uptake protein [Bacteroidales bacterium]
MNWNVISRNVGYALLVNALFMFISILVSVFGGNDSALAAMIISFTITFIVGVFPLIFVRKNTAISLKEGYVIIVLAWLLSFIVGMLPYALWGGPFTLQNAWFESVSGYTTCGATILQDIEDLPKSLLFWRSSTHFIGGLGVVVFLLLIIPESSPMRLRLTNMELTSLSKTGYASRSSRTVIIFASVYVALFVLAALCYVLLGMPVFDAICHAMSVAATGGFSTKNLSIAAFDSRWIEGVTMLFMYLSSIHFGLIYVSVVTRSFKPLCNPVVKAFTMTILAVALVISGWMMLSGTSDNWFEAIWGSLFHTISTVSTTGFAILDNYSWSAWVMMLLALVGIVSGCAGSTTGGLKVDRALLLFKSAGNYVNN